MAPRPPGRPCHASARGAGLTWCLWLGLRFAAVAQGVFSATWGRPVVFEDLAPHLVDPDDGGLPEILTVEAHESLGIRCGGRMAAA